MSKPEDCLIKKCLMFYARITFNAQYLKQSHEILILSFYKSSICKEIYSFF